MFLPGICVVHVYMVSFYVTYDWFSILLNNKIETLKSFFRSVFLTFQLYCDCVVCVYWRSHSCLYVLVISLWLVTRMLRSWWEQVMLLGCCSRCLCSVRVRVLEACLTALALPMGWSRFGWCVMAVEGCAVMVLGVEVCVAVEITGSSGDVAVAVTATEDCCTQLPLPRSALRSCCHYRLVSGRSSIVFHTRLLCLLSFCSVSHALRRCSVSLSFFVVDRKKVNLAVGAELMHALLILHFCSFGLRSSSFARSISAL